MIVKVGYLVSYDYEYLKHSLPTIYSCKNIQEIILVIDKDRLTWSGNSFEIPNTFFDWITLFDIDKKITIIEGSFYNGHAEPIMNETAERNFLFKEMGKCDWYIQLDCDEYFIDFNAFISKLEDIYLDTSIYSKQISIRAQYAILFKKIEKGYLSISPLRERCWIATSNPICYYGRVNKNNRLLELDDIIVHQSWARSEGEVFQKIMNWGHKNDFNTMSYFNLWQSLDKDNYQYISNFHPLKNNDNVWQRLKLLNIESIDTLLQYDKNKIRRIFNPKKLINQV